MYTSKNVEDVEKPLIRYRLKIPQDGFFCPAEIDPRAVLVIRLIAFGLFAAVGCYCFAAWYYTTQVTPEWPNLQLNGLRLSALNLNTSLGYVDAKWEVEFTMQNPQSGWVGRYQPTLSLAHARNRERIADKTFPESIVKPHQSLQVKNKMYSARMTRDETMGSFLKDQKQGVMFLSFSASLKVMYTKSWTDWDSESRSLVFNCDNITLKFFCSNAAIAQDLPKKCVRNLNPEYAKNRQKRI